jgi:hypothetical protein
MGLQALAGRLMAKPPSARHQWYKEEKPRRCPAGLPSPQPARSVQRLGAILPAMRRIAPDSRSSSQVAHRRMRWIDIAN